MLIPMVIPIFYSLKYNKRSSLEIGTITLIMVFIVIAYWPLTLFFSSPANIVTKFLLFVLIPIFILYLIIKKRSKNISEKTDFQLNSFGISKIGFEKSLKYGLFFLPLMILITFISKFFISGNFNSNLLLGLISFIESFTEEFFFRGILFIFLRSRTNLKVAYLTSLLSFVLLHPQNFSNMFIISTITQGILTLEICRRTNNISGAWFLHGTNRFFSIVIYPFLM